MSRVCGGMKVVRMQSAHLRVLIRYKSPLVKLYREIGNT